MKSFKAGFAAFLAYCIAQIILYWSTLNGGPLVDDFRLLNTAKHGGWLANFPAVPNGAHSLFWRPTFSVFLKSEWLAFHLNFAGYRLASIALCALTALAISAFLVNITNSRTAAFASGFLFAIWPTHAETIVWIAGQTDGLATCLAWISLWFFSACQNATKHKALSATLGAITIIAALLAKESAIVMPLIIAALTIAKGLPPPAGEVAEGRWGRIREKAKRFAIPTIVALSLTFGYLALRSQMIHQSLFGGGYEYQTKRSLAEQTWNAFFNYHFTYNLLNAYAPLSSRIARALTWTPDAFIDLLLVFGIALLVHHLPKAQPENDRKRNVALMMWLLNLLCAAWIIFGSYPFIFIASIAQIPAGGVALLLIGALLVALIYRNRKNIAITWSRAAETATTKPYTLLISALFAAYIVWNAFRFGSPLNTLYIYAASFWLVAFTTRKPREENTAYISLILIAASIVALIPILSVKQVDDNLAIARLSYLATTFSVPAIVLGTWSLSKSKLTKTAALATITVFLLIANNSVIQTWTESCRISRNYVEAIESSRAKKIYILASPGIVFSATWVTLGGEFLADSGDLIRDDHPQVIPITFANAFSRGDRLQAKQISSTAWRVTAISTPNPYRGVLITLLPCTPLPSNVHITNLPGDQPTADISLTNLSPSDAVWLVNENGSGDAYAVSH